MNQKWNNLKRPEKKPMDRAEISFSTVTTLVDESLKDPEVNLPPGTQKKLADMIEEKLQAEMSMVLTGRRIGNGKK